jgi:hypothetical protein
MQEVVAQRVCGKCGAADRFPSGACRPCTKTRQRAYPPAVRLLLPDDGMKRCAKCGDEKLGARFGKDRRRIDGRFPYCKECVKQHDAAQHRTRSKSATARRKVLTTRWRDAHRVQLRAWGSAWDKAHPEVKRMIARARRARKKAVPGAGITREDERAIMAVWDWRCAYCGGDLLALPSKERQIDHVLPIAAGGAHDPVNAVPSCAPCNLKKSAKGVFFIKNGVWHILPALAPYAKAA